MGSKYGKFPPQSFTMGRARRRAAAARTPSPGRARRWRPPAGGTPRAPTPAAPSPQPCVQRVAQLAAGAARPRARRRAARRSAGGRPSACSSRSWRRAVSGRRRSGCRSRSARLPGEAGRDLRVEDVRDLGSPDAPQQRHVLARGVQHDLDLGIGEHLGERRRVERLERVEQRDPHASRPASGSSATTCTRHSSAR